MLLSHNLEAGNRDGMKNIEMVSQQLDEFSNSFKQAMVYIKVQSGIILK